MKREMVGWWILGAILILGGVYFFPTGNGIYYVTQVAPDHLETNWGLTIPFILFAMGIACFVSGFLTDYMTKNPRREDA